MAAALTIEGIVIASLKTFTVQQSDCYDGDAERNANWDFIGDWVNEKRKLEVGIGLLTQEKSSELLSKIRKGKVISVTYIDPDIGMATKTFYVSDRKVKLYSYINDVATWESMSFSLIER